MTEILLIVLGTVSLFVLTYFVGRYSGQTDAGDELEPVEYNDEDTEPSTAISDLTDFRDDGLQHEDGRTADEIESDLKKKLQTFDP